MKIIKSITFVTLLVAFVTASYAQKSAQATMKVSVTVVKGISTQANPISALTFEENHVSGKLGSIELAGVNSDGEMIISTPNVLSLYNEEGDQMKIPVEMKRELTSNNVNLQFISGMQEGTGNRYEGYYRGSLTTQIEYL